MKIRNIAFSGFMASILMAGAAYADTVLATKSYVDSGVDYALQHAKDYVDDSTYITKADGTNAGEYSLNAKIATFKTDGSVNADGLVTGSQLAAANADTAELKETVAGHTTDISNLKAKDTELAEDIADNAAAIATINDSDVMKSGITSAKVNGYDSHIANNDIHVTAAQKTEWSDKQDALDATQLAAVNSGIDSDKVAQIATNTSGIATNAAAIQTNTTNIGTNTTNITNLTGRVTTAEGDIDALETGKQDKVLGTYSKATAASAIGTTDTVSGALGKLEYKVDTKANSADVYTKSETYTKTEVDTALNGKQNTLTGQNGVVVDQTGKTVGLATTGYQSGNTSFWGYNGSTWNLVNVTGDTYPGN